MSTLVWLLAWIVVAMLVVVIAVVVTPVTLHLLAATSKPKARFAVEARLLGGVAPAIRVVDSERQQRKEGTKKPPPQPKASEAGSTKTGVQKPSTPVLRAGITFLRESLRVIHLDRLDVSGDFGLGDPADTGHVFGLLAPLMYASPHASRLSVNMRPDFDRARFDGQVEADVRFIPAAFVPPAARFAWRAFGPGA